MVMPKVFAQFAEKMDGERRRRIDAPSSKAARI
jgi:hypothetical protein